MDFYFQLDICVLQSDSLGQGSYDPKAFLAASVLIPTRDVRDFSIGPLLENNTRQTELFHVPEDYDFRFGRLVMFNAPKASVVTSNYPTMTDDPPN